MDVVIEKSLIRGKVDVPPSKSMTIRAILCAALSNGSTYLRFPLIGEDTRIMVDALSACGIRFKPVRNGIQIDGGTIKVPEKEIYCGESSAVFRFMLAFATLVPGTVRVVAGSNLSSRPVAPLVEVLISLGAKCTIEGSTVVIEGGNCEGGEINIPGNISSQFISALMIVSARYKNGLSMRFSTPLKSKAYIDMTEACMNDFSVRCRIPQSYFSVTVSPQTYHEITYTPEGDWSFATTLLALGAITSSRQFITTSNGNQIANVLVTNLNAESKQADRMILNMFQKMGGSFTMRQTSVMVAASRLYPLNTVNFSDCITLFPIMAVMASTVIGMQSSCRGLAAERKKYNNDVDIILGEFKKLGIRCIDNGDSIQIMGGIPTGYDVDTHGSSRVGLALCVLGATVGNITIRNVECLEETYPNIWKTLETVGVRVRVLET